MHQNLATWGRFLVWAEWSYNTSVHSATGLTPYEVTFGKQPPSLPQYLARNLNVQAVDEWLTQRETIIASLIKKLTKAQQRMKEITDKRRRDVSYEEGDTVLVKLLPRRQTSVIGEAYLKLTKRYYGPFQIVKKIGSVAYQLNLPSSSRIYPVFHCSLLKPYHSSNTEVPLDLPASSEGNEPLITPLAILDTKWENTPTGRQLLILVQWTGLVPEDTSWEKWEPLKRDYNLEDKVVLEAGRNVMNPKLTRRTEQFKGKEAGAKRRISRPKYLDDYMAK